MAKPRRSKTATVAHLGLGILAGLGVAGTVGAVVLPAAGAAALLTFLGSLAGPVAGLAGVGAAAVGARHWGAKEGSESSDAGGRRTHPDDVG
jgi:hypothetical protein